MTTVRDVRALLAITQTAYARHTGDINVRATRSKTNTPLHIVADAHLSSMKRAIMTAMKASRAVIDVPMLQKAIATGDQQLAETAVLAVPSAFKAKLKALLPLILKKTLIAGGEVGAKELSAKLRTATRWCKVTELNGRSVGAHRAMRGSDLCHYHGGVTLRTAADKFEFDPEDELVQAWIDEHAAELADQLANTTEEDVAAALQDAFDAGELDGLEETIVAIAEDADRSAMIAINEVMSAVNEGQRQAWDQATDEGFLSDNKVRQWNTADADACPECDDLDGETAEISEPYSNGEMGPPLHPNCVPGCVIVEGDVVAATRMLYDGCLYKITTVNGRSLLITPNHPVATARGFIPAHEITESDELITYNERVEKFNVDSFFPAGVSAAPQNNKHGPTKIEEVFRTCQVLGKITTWSRLGDEFDNDAMAGNGDIDVIYVDIKLGNRIEATLLDNLESFNFKSPDRFTSDLSDPLSMNQSVGLAEASKTISSAQFRSKFGRSLKRSSFNDVTSFNSKVSEAFPENTTRDTSLLLQLQERLPSDVLSSQIFDDSQRDVDVIRFGQVSNLNTALYELSSKFVKRDATFIRELRKRLAQLISVDQVVEIRKEHFIGHVYDLQTANGVIVSQGLIISNCRCTEVLVERPAPRTAGDKEGHEFHGNQWTNQISPIGFSNNVMEGLAPLQRSQLLHIANILKVAATRMDFPPDKMRIEKIDRNFAVGGKQFTEGGHFNPSTGEIVLSADMLAHISATDAEAILAHEVTHRDWDQVNKALGLEGGGGPEKMVDPKLIPTAEKVQNILSEEGQQLEQEDGITKYSRAYWDEIPKEPAWVKRDDPEHPWLDQNTGELYKTRPVFDPPEDYDEKYLTAVNETLAEIRKVELLRAQGKPPNGKDVFDPTPRWRRLHEAVKQTAKELRQAHV